MWTVALLLAMGGLDPENLARQVRMAGATGVRVERVQLDGDAPLEALVRYEMADSGAHAVVLDPVGDGWREAGRVNTWWNYVAEDGARLIELRAVVEASVMDLVVRVRSGETEHARTTLSIYRMRDGRLVNVLDVKEHETAMEHPSGHVFTTRAEIAYAPGRVTVRSKREPGGRLECAAYQWDSARFRFEEEACR